MGERIHVRVRTALRRSTDVGYSLVGFLLGFCLGSFCCSGTGPVSWPSREQSEVGLGLVLSDHRL